MYSILLTYKCNWFCNFCNVDTHNQPEPDFDNIKDIIESIPEGAEVSISGGEPGLLSREKMEYCIDKLRTKNAIINVNTNGTFFSNFGDLIEQIDSIYYHCSEDLDIKKGINLYNNIDYTKTEFMLTVTDDNFHNLGWFIESYPDILFKIQGADQHIVNGKPGTKLSNKNAIKIMIDYKDKVDKDSYMYLLGKCKDIEELKVYR